MRGVGSPLIGVIFTLLLHASRGVCFHNASVSGPYDDSLPGNIGRIEKQKLILSSKTRVVFDALVNVVRAGWSRIKSSLQATIAKVHPSIINDEDDWSTLTWNGRQISSEEHFALSELRYRISAKANICSQWLRDPEGVDILRFLRARQGHVNATWKMLEAHDLWRTSVYGAESRNLSQFFVNSPLRQEVFWIGLSRSGCALLVVRTQVHDGYYYNNDPKIYGGHFVWVLEEGRRRYGVGITTPVCVLLDRGGVVFKNGNLKIDALDMKSLPALVELFRHLHDILMSNYPELLQSALVVPASWFFSMCYAITSSVLTPQQRKKIVMIAQNDLIKLQNEVPLSLLPSHLGGHSSAYKTEVWIDFKPEDSVFPIDSQLIQSFYQDVKEANKTGFWYG